jgi:rfaE bifunctional protein nucleotidyltransferase chain/domain
MNYTQLIENKILDFRIKEAKTALKRTLSFLNFKDLAVGFTNGCFDILHLGHIDYLSQAANKCDFLIVGLNTDSSVRRIKGEHRPINDETTRAKIMASLMFIDIIVFFEEDTPLKLIEFVNPSMLFKGSDYKVNEIVGYDFVSKNGGKVETINLTEGYSTTNIEQKILSYVKK